MLSITLNAKEYHCPQGSSLADVLHTQGDFKPPFAVAVNRTFVPRTDYDSTVLASGDAIDIITAMPGG